MTTVSELAAQAAGQTPAAPATRTIQDALNAAKAQTATPTEGAAEGTAKVKKPRKPRTPKDPNAPAKTPRAKKEKVEKEARAKVDAAWVEDLKARANADETIKGLLPEGASVDFSVAKSKGRLVSMSPKIVHQNGSVSSAGPANRVGFCTNRDYPAWMAKMITAVQACIDKGASRTAVSRNPLTKALREKFGDQVKGSGQRILITTAEEVKVGLSSKDNSIKVTMARGPIDAVHLLLVAIVEVVGTLA